MATFPGWTSVYTGGGMCGLRHPGHWTFVRTGTVPDLVHKSISRCLNCWFLNVINIVHFSFHWIIHIGLDLLVVVHIYIFLLFVLHSKRSVVLIYCVPMDIRMSATSTALALWRTPWSTMMTVQKSSGKSLFFILLVVLQGSRITFFTRSTVASSWTF